MRRRASEQQTLCGITARASLPEAFRIWDAKTPKLCTDGDDWMKRHKNIKRQHGQVVSFRYTIHITHSCLNLDMLSAAP